MSERLIGILRSSLPGIGMIKLLAITVLTSTFAALPDSAVAASGSAVKQAKAGTSSRRLSKTSANSARNSAVRSSRAANGRTATKTGGTENGSTPGSWSQPPPSMSADLRRAIGNGIALKPTPVRLPSGDAALLKPARHKMREYRPSGLGKVTDTQPMTPAERDISVSKGYQTIYSERLRRLDHYMAGRGNAYFDRRSLLSDIRAKSNAQATESRAVSGRSATRTKLSAGPSGPETPSNWRQPAPPMSADLRRAIATGVALKPIPVKLPDGQPGQLKPARHKMREYKSPGLGKVVDTKPMTPAERNVSIGKGYSRVYHLRLRKVDSYLETRNGGSYMSRLNMLTQIQNQANATKANLRAVNSRSSATVTGSTGRAGAEQPSNWQRPIQHRVSDSTTGTVQLKSTPAPLSDTWTSPPRLIVSSRKTQSSASPDTGI